MGAYHDAGSVRSGSGEQDLVIVGRQGLTEKEGVIVDHSVVFAGLVFFVDVLDFDVLDFYGSRRVLL